MAKFGRWMFLRLAHSGTVEAWAKRLGSGVAGRFVAGDDLAEALAKVKELNGDGFAVTLDHLGESVHDAAAARAAAAEYVEAVHALRKAQLNATVSVKLTQMGLDVEPQLAEENVRAILEAAGSGAGAQPEHNADQGGADAAPTFVRIDMEDSSYVDATLDLYRRLRADGIDHVGVVLQAYMRRSPDDLAALAPLKPQVRIVKGAYEEASAVAFKGYEEIRQAYLRLLEQALDVCPRVCIATHDDMLIDGALERISSHGASPDQYEFQMLYGVRGELAAQVRDRQQPVRIYLPYGADWYPYFMRRLAERPSDAWKFARLIFARR